MFVDRAAQFLNSCHLCVCTYIHVQHLPDQKGSKISGQREEPDRIHTNSKKANQQFLFSRRGNVSSFGSVSVSMRFLHLVKSAARAATSRWRSRAIRSQAEQRTSTVSSMTVTNEIKKHFLNESRQGGAPDRVFASQGCTNLLQPPPCPEHRPLPICSAGLDLT